MFLRGVAMIKNVEAYQTEDKALHPTLQEAAKRELELSIQHSVDQIRNRLRLDSRQSLRLRNIDFAEELWTEFDRLVKNSKKLKNGCY